MIIDRIIDLTSHLYTHTWSYGAGMGAGRRRAARTAISHFEMCSLSHRHTQVFYTHAWYDAL